MSGGWQDYISSLQTSGFCQDSAIIGIGDNPSVWAAHPGGFLCKTKPQEVLLLIAKDRTPLFISGITLGGQKMSLIQDKMDTEGSIDARTKTTSGGQTYAVSINRTCQTLVIVVGKEGVHGGTLNTSVNRIVEHMKSSGF